MKGLLLVLSVVPFLCQGQAVRDFGRYSEYFFPAKEALDYEKGTYEAWWRVNYDKKENFQKDPNYPAGGLSLFSLRDLKGNNLLRDERDGMPAMNLYLVDHPKGHYVKFITRLTETGNRPTGIVLSFDELEWDKAGWHYFAISWEKTGTSYEFILTCDGKTKSIKAKAVKLQHEKALICLGAVNMGRGTLDAVQIHSSVLSPELRSKSFESGLFQQKSGTFFKKGTDLLRVKEIQISRENYGLMEQGKAEKK